jgi:hypothetical protein
LIFGIGQDPRDLGIFVDRRAADVHDHGGVPRAQLGQLLADEPPHPDPLQADRVQHSRGRFDDPRRRMPFTLVQEQPFDRDAAEH